MSFESTVGVLGAVNVALLQLPQLRKIYTTKQTDDLSWITILLHTTACLLWFTYGLLIQKFPIILCNVIYGMATIATIYFKRKYDRSSYRMNTDTVTTASV